MLARVAIAVFLAFATAQAQAEPVDVELVLAADGSGSIDDDELALQREGYASALTSREFLDVVSSGANQAVAVAYIEWGGPLSQHTIVDWHVIRDQASADAFAARVRAEPRQAYGYNSISAAIDYSARLIAENAHDGFRKVIDVSGDGPNIGGRLVQSARDDAVAAGITINGLVINRTGGVVRRVAGEPLIEHYRRDVIGGPGSFVMSVEETARFAEVVRRKLVLEIAAR